MVFFPPVRSLVKDVSGPPVMPSDRLVGAAPDNPDILTPVIVNNAMTLNQGDSVTLTGAILSATDGDTSDPSLSFTVSGVTFGQFERVSNPGASVTVFQQSEITAGAVVFVHDGTANAPAYSVQVSDGTNSSGVAAATITFTPVSYPLDVTAGGPVITGGSQVGTLVVRATSDGDSSDQVMVQFDDGTDDNRINFYREAGNMTLYAKSGGSFEAN
ncbi:MAG: cadherin-like domain-containing protein, partial [Pseudomonadota bacterium]